MKLQGKTALVTGGAKRVGKAIALELARQGVNLILHYHTSAKEAAETASEIKKIGVSCHLAQADLGASDSIRQMLTEVKKIGSVDILVNSASLYYKTPVETATEAQFDELMGANLKAPYLLSVEIGREMKLRGGKIINIADWSGFRPYKDYLAYCTTKGGLITLTKALARDLAPLVSVNAVAPGPVLAPPDLSENEKEVIAKTTALGRWGKPEDVANAAIYLLESDFVNGTVLVVDGGRSII